MDQSLLAATLLLHLPLQSTAQVVSTASDLGILQLVTPTTHASLVPEIALLTLSADAASFCSSYRDIDSFNLATAIATAVASAATTPNLGLSLVAQENVLFTVYEHATTSFLNNPTEYLTRLRAAAAPWPFSAALMSQASGILAGYESLVSRDVLNLTATGGSVTPGMSVSVAAGTTASGGGATGATATTPSTASSKAGGVPAATVDVQLALSAVAAVAGVVGMI